MMKRAFEELENKVLIYRDCKSFTLDKFKLEVFHKLLVKLNENHLKEYLENLNVASNSKLW